MGMKNFERVVVATDNSHKLEEISAITEKFGLKAVGRSQAGAGGFEIIEDGATFEENSLIKARAIFEKMREPTIADDSGLMVEALHGAPGVLSARFAGEHGNDKKNNEKLLSLMECIPYKERHAKFVSVITLVLDDDDVIVARGECPGHILLEPAGSNGFGYDPLFVPEGFQRSFAQLTSEEKNAISHRAKALEKLEEILRARGTDRN